MDSRKVEVSLEKLHFLTLCCMILVNSNRTAFISSKIIWSRRPFSSTLQKVDTRPWLLPAGLLQNIGRQICSTDSLIWLRVLIGVIYLQIGSWFLKPMSRWPGIFLGPLSSFQNLTFLRKKCEHVLCKLYKVFGGIMQWVRVSKYSHSFWNSSTT